MISSLCQVLQNSVCASINLQSLRQEHLGGEIVQTTNRVQMPLSSMPIFRHDFSFLLLLLLLFDGFRGLIFLT